MSLHLFASVYFGHRKETQLGTHNRLSRFSASLDTGVRTSPSPNFDSMCFKEMKERIAKLINKPELSVSTYDTAWVAMVPSPHSSHDPCFPDSLKWLLENQCSNGSWARPHHHSLLQKDVLSSTLACVLALRKWGIGEEQIHRGVHFIESNFASVLEKSQISPIGFDIVFPAMVEYAKDMFLNLNLEQTKLSDMMHRRELELKRWSQNQSTEREVSLAYFCEGLGNLQNWERVMKNQRKNGSLFNSPSATAAAFIGLHDVGCLNYLKSTLKSFGDAVPALHPFDIYLKLCTVDSLARLGISRHFMKEIKNLLDEAYRFWLQGDEEIFLDASTCALAFRILRENGYAVTSDRITKVLQEYRSSSFDGNTTDLHTILELYRASEFVMYPDEADLEKQNLRLKHLLEEELSQNFVFSSKLGRNIEQEVKHALEYPFYAIIHRFENRISVEHYNTNNTRVLKTALSSLNFGNKDFLSLSVYDFNKCQQVHCEEMKELERWVVENRFEELKFARSKLAYCYFSAAATIFDPNLSDARMSWAKNGVLTTVVDDFFDVGGSIEELKQLIQLIEEWEDVDVDSIQFASTNVQIIFSALKGTICEISNNSFIQQGRSVTNHIVKIWLDLMKSMMKETEWTKDGTRPTMDEYMSNAYTSFALGPIVLPALYLVGPKLSEEMVQHPEYHRLFKLMSTCGRLLNDIQSCERETKEGKLNAIPLYMCNGGREITKEAAVTEMKSRINSHRRELLRLVLEGKKSVIPKPCKDLFWHMCTVVSQFYREGDGFTSQDLIKVVKSIVYEPIVLKEL